VYAQTVNEPLVRQRVEEALQKHRKDKQAQQTDAEQQERTRKAEARASKTAEYIESQRKLSSDAETNIEAARKWSIEEMKERHSLMRCDNYSRANSNITKTNQIKSESYGDIDIAPQGIFYSREELDIRLRRIYFAENVQASESKPITLLKKAWDFIDMDYVDYLNSDRRSLGEDIARGFYKDVRDVIVQSNEKLGQKWDDIVAFMKSDWGRLYDQKSLEIKEGIISETPARSLKFIGRLSPNASYATNKISVTQILSQDLTVSISRILSADFAKMAVDAAATGDISEAESYGTQMASDVTDIAATVVEKETGTRIKRINLTPESLSEKVATDVRSKLGDSAKRKLGTRFYDEIKKMYPDAVEKYETAKYILK